MRYIIQLGRFEVWIKLTSSFGILMEVLAKAAADVFVVLLLVGQRAQFCCTLVACG